MTSVDVLFDRGLDLVTDVVDRTGPEVWGRPSPCRGWTALDVLGHLTSAQEMGIRIMQGEPPTWTDVERPGAAVTGEPAALWRDVAARARAAFAGADLGRVVESPRGSRTVADGLAFPTIDLYVHAWDIGRTGGLDVVVPDDLVAFAHRYIDPVPVDLVRGERGAFGPEAATPPDATPTEVFIAWTGRPPR